MTPPKIGLIKCSFVKFSQPKDMAYIQLGFRNYFILKRHRFLAAAIFIGSASPVQKSFKINVLKLPFLVLSRLS